MLRNKFEITKKFKKKVEVPIISLASGEDINKKITSKNKSKNIPIKYKTVNSTDEPKRQDIVKAIILINKNTDNQERGRKLILSNEKNCFAIHNGPKLHNLIELRDAVAQMKNDLFRYHLNSEKNDFYNWITTVLKDSECAEDIKYCKTQTLFVDQIDKHLSKYNID